MALKETHVVAAQHPHPARWRILGLLGIAQLMLILDVTVVAIALPHIGSELGLSRAALTWTVSAYTLAFGGALLLGGRLADLVGAKRVAVVGLLAFAAASLVTGVAGSSAMLLGGRVAQGIAAAMLSPAALSLVVTLFDGDERNKALGVWSALGGGGAAIGLILGGVLTAGPGWPWVFYINVPVGLVVALALARMLPRNRAVAPGARLDVVGAVLVTASSGAVIYALINAGDVGWLTPTTGWLLALGALGYLAFVIRQRRARSPLVDMGLLTRRTVVVGTFLVLMATALMIAMFFLGTFYFQHGRGYGALRTGLLFLPVALTTMLGANLTGRVLARTGLRLPAVLGFVVAAVGLAVPAAALNPVTVVVGMAVGAAGAGALFVVAAATALGQVAPHEAGVASGIVSTFHEFGAAVGAAAVSSAAAASLAGDGSTGYTDGFVLAFVAAAVAAVVVGVVTARRRAPVGR
jgi:EmrB/QacA subfamily drug resistance transporter